MENESKPESTIVPEALDEWTPLELEKVAWLFPQFAILGMVGRGTVGAVYRGFDAAGDRTVAIKILPLEVSQAPGIARAFAKTLPLVSQLAHGNIVTVREFGLTAQEHLFLIADHVEGTTLRERIAGGKLTPMQVFAMLEQVCDAAHHAHGHGVIHGALHPGNVFVDQHGPVKVADFGMSRFRLSHADLNGARAYLAPEQVGGLHADHRADIFSVGVMLYEALTGELPHADSAPASERVAVPPRIDAVIARAMEASPEARYPSCADLMRAIATVRALAAPGARAMAGPVAVGGAAVPSPVRYASVDPDFAAKKRRLPMWIGGGMAAVALVAAGYFVAQGDKKSAAPPTPVFKVAEWPTVVTPVPPVPPPKVAVKPVEPPKPAAEPVPVVEAKPATTAPTAGTWVPVPLDAASTGGAREIEDGAIHLTKTVRFDRFRAKDVAVRAMIRLGEEGKAAQLWLRNLSPSRAQIVLDGKPNCFIQTTVEANKFRSFGTVTAPWALVGDRWVTVQFAAVGAKLFGAVNERAVPVETPSDVLEAGGIGIYSVDADIKDLAVMVLDNVSPEQYPEFVKTALAAALAKAGPEPAPLPMAVVPQMPAAPKASPEVEIWLTTVAKPFEDKYQREVAEPFETAIAELRKSYIATLERQSAAASQAAKLDEALAWRNERQRFFDSGHKMPADDSDNPIPAIKPLRAAFRAQFSKLDRERYERARVQFAVYDAILEKNQNGLTQGQRLDDAMLLKTKREELAKSWLVPPASAPLPVTPAPVGSKITAAPEPSKQTLRDTVTWLLANGTDLTFYDGKKWSSVIDARLLPVGKPSFKVKIDAAKFKTPLTSVEMQRLGALRMVTLFETNTRFDEKAYAFLRELEGIERLQLPGDKLTDAIGDHLSSLSDLKSLQIHGGQDWTGKTLDVLAKFPGLKQVSLEYAGITDEGAEALSKITSIEELFLRKTKITDAGLASLAKLRNLRRLGLNETAVTADGLAVLKGLKNLESIGFLSSDLPDYADAVKKMAVAFPRLISTYVRGKTLGKEHFEPLASWRSLTHLAVSDAQLQGGAVPAIGKLAGLEWLEITNMAFGDIDVDALLGLKSLKRITLGGTKISDSGLLKLKALKNLKEVNVPNTPVTIEGARALEREHAGCKVTR